LDTEVITKIPGYKMLNYGRTSDGSAIELPKISVFHSREVTIETRKPREVAADGQVVTQTPAFPKKIFASLSLEDENSKTLYLGPFFC